MGTELSDRFFGGISNVKRRLVDSLREARERQGEQPKVVDAICLLGRETPKCEEYEEDPQTITALLSPSFLHISN